MGLVQYNMKASWNAAEDSATLAQYTVPNYIILLQFKWFLLTYRM